MKIHEYQAKELLKKYGVPVPHGRVADTPQEARGIAEELGCPVVVKAQIHAGGRGKGGGIKEANTPDEAEQAAASIIGMNLVTHQTGPEGRLVRRVLVEEAGDITHELYLGIVIDRVSECPVIMASEAGGMDIEEVAAKTPEKIVRVAIDPAVGLLPFHVRKLSYGLNITDDYINIVFESVRRHPIPSPPHEMELLKRVKEGDRDARDELLATNKHLVETVARRYLAHGHPMAELVNVGIEGLKKAIEGYDPAKEYKFRPSAIWWIRQSLTQFLAQKGRSVHKELTGKIGRIISGLYKTFIECDCSLAEINPLAITAEGEAFALDAKINIDDNALYRHKEIAELRDAAEEQPLEVEASKHNLSYIKLDGAVGCMVNGAGLAMATMDIIKLHGQMPANFLDVGGAASSERVANAFRILTSDANVKAVLINIFGGIVRCDRVATGIVEALKEVDVNVPIVVRLEGTNAEEAREILEKSGLKFTVASTLDDAARKAVAAVG